MANVMLENLDGFSSVSMYRHLKSAGFASDFEFWIWVNEYK